MQDRDTSWLAGPDLDRFRAIGTRRRYPVGSTLFVEGDEPSEVLLLESGEVKLTAAALSGQEVVLDVVLAGALLGELSAFDGGRRSATGVAMTPVEGISVSVERFNAFLRDHPVATHALLAQTILRLRLSDRRRLEYASSDALARVCARLDELATRFEGRVLPLTQTELAQWCGLSREAVVKALRKLRDLGWISTAHGRITVLERDQVRVRGTT